ncbi:Sec-independent protein translocase subunit TatA [Streptomyces sp. SCSIO 30461]|uniref:Sec-independent protein translocase subunit TatA n=1 Tax=Streptomyces sp. SCSIO 30461 TaxID=3118085 RepID=UPI0030D15256
MLRNGLEPWHLLIVVLVVVVLFGSRKLPDTARALGKSIRILKSEAKAMRADDATPQPAESFSGGESGAPVPRVVKDAPGAGVAGAPPVDDGNGAR